jgi:hypothetical protein
MCSEEQRQYWLTYWETNKTAGNNIPNWKTFHIPNCHVVDFLCEDKKQLICLNFQMLLNGVVDSVRTEVSSKWGSWFYCWGSEKE